MPKCVPSLLGRRPDQVPFEETPDWHLGALVKENLHGASALAMDQGRRAIEAARGKLDDGFHLFAIQSVEPLHDVV